MTRRAAWAPVSAAALLTLLLTLPSGIAEHGAFGDVITVASPEVVVELKTIASAAVCFVDADGNGGYGAGDPVILSINNGCNGNSEGSDIRLARWGTNAGGERLGVAGDTNRPLSTPPGGTVSFWFYDANGNGRMDAGDTAYANIKNPQIGFVDVADVRLSPFGDAPAGEQLRQGDADLGRTLLLLGTPAAALGYVDTNDNNQFDHIDMPYVNSDLGGAETVEFGDLRLLPVTDDRPFGSFVEPGDGDGDVRLTSVSRSLCFADTDGSGGYNGGDPLFFDIDANCVGNVQPGDIRLITTGSGVAGSRVTASDTDFGLASSALASAEAAFIDNDGDARFTIGDVFYLDIIDPSSRRVDVGDVRLTPTSDMGGSPVAAADPSVGSTLRSLGLLSVRLAFIAYAGGNTPGTDDPVYINVDGGSNEGVEPNDVRLVRVRSLPFGANTRLSDGDVLASLTTSSAAVCFTAGNTGSTYRAGDAVYLALFGGCSSTVGVGMLRLVQVAGFAPGTAVATIDSDHGGTVQAVSGTMSWKYFDADGDSEWSLGDMLYLDVVSETSDRVDVGDLRISDGALPGGQAVVGGNSDVSLPLRALGAVSGRAGFVDGNGDGTFGPADYAYVDAGANGGFVTVLDVRLTPLPPHTPDPMDDDNVTSPPGDPGQPPPPDDQDDADDPPVEGPDGTGNVTDEGNDTGPRGRTPAPALPLIILTLAGLLALARRRQ